MAFSSSVSCSVHRRIHTTRLPYSESAYASKALAFVLIMVAYFALMSFQRNKRTPNF